VIPVGEIKGRVINFSTILADLSEDSYQTIAVGNGTPETSLYAPEGNPPPGPPSIK
jgi:hypothetical protein